MSVTIGIDPHKSTHTAVAVDRDERPIARFTFPARAGQTERLLAWAEPLDADRVWAIESAAGLGRLLAHQLVAVGERVVDVPPTLSARVRLLANQKTSKNDTNDALSTAIAGMRHCGLRTVHSDGHTVVLRLLTDRFHDLTGLRTQAVCRLHVLFRELVPGGARLRSAQARPVNCSPASSLATPSRSSVACKPKRIWRTSNASTGRSPHAVNASPLRSPKRGPRSSSCMVSGRSSRQ